MRTLCLLLAACGPPKDFRVDLEPDADVLDTDLPVAPGAACDQDLAFSPQGVPEFQQTFPLSWSEGDATFTISQYSGRRTFVTKEDDGCITLDNGLVSLELRKTGCAASSMRVSATSLCPAASCIEVSAEADGELRGSAKSARTDEAEVISLTPSLPFLQAKVAAVNFTLCGISVTQAPIPEDLRGIDTAEPF